MNVNKKFDRLKQWGKERMGGEVRTDTSDEFKSLEVEMQLRQEGMERLQRSATGYIKSISKRDQGEDRDRQLPISYFGSVMVGHSDDFEPDSQFGQCLSSLGRANERIGRMQETYVANATSSWLESLERSLVQMKEYQTAKKKLDSRRLAYDTAQTKVEKSKKEDFRVEEELRSQKAKYEENNEDVYRRMLDIKEAEVDSIADITSFLEAEFQYYDRCREVLVQLKKDWPASTSQMDGFGTASPGADLGCRKTRSRSNTATSLTDRFNRVGGIAENEPLDSSQRFSSRLPSAQNSPRRELPGFDFPSYPARSRANSGFEGPAGLGRESSPASMARLTRVPTDPAQILNARSNLRLARQGSSNIFDDASSQAAGGASDSTSAPAAQDGSTTGKRAPPPPPPSRAKKPPPPAPLKRNAASTSVVSHY